ncbi:hypothetical protein OOK13_45125 [Streptomyces sp. NBC_00378]|uniref:hypothetical protein n=1 Tax=Streptomyces sp. NBC_00378 TaxID=2975732 RepID=UPI00224E17DE|nr:hypothetical protein [Streptomyces sp. NBC_00378]MCX5115482.1 hypothetical protein [Streptomyces sp. NBC_00378]
MTSSHGQSGADQQQPEPPNRYKLDLTGFLPDGNDLARGAITGAIALGQGLTTGGAVALGAVAAVPGRRAQR